MRVFNTSPDQLCKCLCVGLQEEQSKNFHLNPFFIFVCMKKQEFSNAKTLLNSS